MNYGEFYRYLKKKGHGESTMANHLATLKSFALWCAASGHADPARLRYTDLLGYVGQEKERGIVTATLNQKLVTIRHWYESLKASGEIEANPAKRVKLRNQKKTVIKNTLQWSEMEMLYENYAKEKTYREQWQEHPHQRNTAILGLLIEQALQACELPLLQTGHIDPKKGTVTVPASPKGAERTLKLAPHQILTLHQYINVGRKEILKRLTPPQREAANQKEQLFPGNHANTINHLFKELGKTNPKVENSHQIRNSVIMQWVKMYGLRQVQYMAGHKQASTTEKYVAQDTDGLRDKLTKYHPFG